MKKQVTVSLEEDLIATLRAIADQENRTLSNLVETLLSQAVDDK